MLLLSRHYALAAEEQRAEQLFDLQEHLLTPAERDSGVKLAPPPRRRRAAEAAQAAQAVEAATVADDE